MRSELMTIIIMKKISGKTSYFEFSTAIANNVHFKKIRNLEFTNLFQFIYIYATNN